MSVLNKLISKYPSVSTTSGGEIVNLLDLLNSCEYKQPIMNLRQCCDGTKQKELKNKLPCFTVAGVFNRRCNDGLIVPSGLAAVDLDSAEHYDVLDLLSELKKLPCIAYGGLSCRGKRLFCIVPFLYPDKYVKQYQRLMQSFVDWGLPMGDDCHLRISQPRFVSWNENYTQFFNHDARPYHLLPAERTIYIPSGDSARHPIRFPQNTFRWCSEQIEKRNPFAQGNRHRFIIRLARYCNLKGLTKNETLDGCLSYSGEDFPATEIKGIVEYIYSKQKDSHNRFPFHK